MSYMGGFVTKARFDAHTHPISAPTKDVNAIRVISGAVETHNCGAISCNAGALKATNVETVNGGAVTAIPSATGAPS